MKLENIKDYIWLLNIISVILGFLSVFSPFVHHSETGFNSDYFLLGFKIDHYPIGPQYDYYGTDSVLYRVGMTTLLVIIIACIFLLINSLPLLLRKVKTWSKVWISSIFWLVSGLLMISGVLFFYIEMNLMDSSFWNYWTLSGGILPLIGGCLAVFSTILKSLISLIISRRSNINKIRNSD
ncbi:MAG: hypothetical protein ACFFBH_02300 [Promethearchaeota archaeon]